MKTYTHVRNRLVLGLVVLSFSLTLIPITGSLPIEKEHLKMMNGSDGIVISGTMGENGWYISDVSITLNFSGWPGPIFYNIDHEGWNLYSGIPLLVDTDGKHSVDIICYDQEGNIENISSATFKIDKTPPNLILSKETIGQNQIKFVAIVSDATSGIWRVEFYLDDEPVFIVYDSPYETRALYSRKHHVIAIVFDFAGHSEAGNMSTPYVFSGDQKSLNHMYSFYYGFRMTFMESFAFATS
jgi:hypothetical protein